VSAADRLRQLSEAAISESSSTSGRPTFGLMTRRSR
jgi:hypothetical protein